MHAYAVEQVATLLNRLEHEIEHTRAIPDAEAVHDLRVTIRRFGQSLRVFSQYLPSRASKRIRKQLHHIMGLTGEVRNRDITRDLLDEARLPAAAETLQAERDKAARELIAELERWSGDHEGLVWRTELELPIA